MIVSWKRNALGMALIAVALFLASVCLVGVPLDKAQATGAEPTKVSISYDTASKTLTVSPDEAGTDIRSALTSFMQKSDVEKIVISSAVVAPESMVNAFSDPWGIDYYSNLTTIEGLERVDTANVTNMAYLFSGCPSLKTLDLSGFNTENVVYMDFMFYGCSSLEALDLSNFNTENVEVMWSMFDGCSSLKTLNLSSFNTKNVEDMDYMFYGCSSLEALDLSNFNTENVEVMWSMFDGCSSLKTLNLSSFNTKNVEDMDYMFYGCSSLETLDLSGFNTENVVYHSEMFHDCLSLTSVKTGLLKPVIASQIYAKLNAQGTSMWNKDGVAVSGITPDEAGTYIATADEGFTFVVFNSLVDGTSITQSVVTNSLLDPAAFPAGNGKSVELYKSTTLTEQSKWNFSTDVVSAPMELFYQTVLASYHIEYNLYGGTNAASNPESYTVETPTINLANPVRTGSIFDGWYENASFTGLPITTISQGSTENVELHAKWLVNAYTITFDSAGGSAVAPQSVIYGTQVLEPQDPTREGFTFKGWYKEGTLYNFSQNVTENTTLVAYWEQVLPAGQGSSSSIVPATGDSTVLWISLVVVLGFVGLVGVAAYTLSRKKR